MDRLKTTAESHHRVMVVEVMGRHTGLDRPGGRHGRRRPRHLPPRAPLRPGRPGRVGRASGFERGKKFADHRASPRARHPAEGTMDSRQGRASTSSATSAWAASATRAGLRARGAGSARRPGRSSWATSSAAASPRAYDRVLATRFGWHAVEAAHKGAFGRMTALHGTRVDAHGAAGGRRDLLEDGPRGPHGGGGVGLLTGTAAFSRGPSTQGQPQPRSRRSHTASSGGSVRARLAGARARATPQVLTWSGRATPLPPRSAPRRCSAQASTPGGARRGR